MSQIYLNIKVIHYYLETWKTILRISILSLEKDMDFAKKKLKKKTQNVERNKKNHAFVYLNIFWNKIA